MSRTRSKKKSFIPILILSLAVGLWIYDAYNQGSLRKFFEPKGNTPVATSTGSGSSKSTTAEIPSNGRYEIFKNCTLATDRGNDGDSFRVKFPGGRSEIIRLYFVDTPESAFKSYGGGENNHDRIAQQAEDMGSISSEDAVKIGKKAKDYTISLLAAAPFSIHTEWDSPFNDKRYHAFVVVSEKGKPRFLHELLVEKGYARIHTKGSQLPDGTSERKQEDHLLSLQKNAKSKKAGAWGL